MAGYLSLVGPLLAVDGEDPIPQQVTQDIVVETTLDSRNRHSALESCRATGYRRGEGERDYFAVVGEIGLEDVLDVGGVDGVDVVAEGGESPES